MTVEHAKRDYIGEGEASYQRWAGSLVADDEGRRLYEEEAARKELWLQLVEARQAAGLTQAQLAERLGVSQSQVARIEKRGYDAYTLNSLRRYVKALGDGFRLEVRVQHDPGRPTAHAQAPVRVTGHPPRIHRGSRVGESLP